MFNLELAWDRPTKIRTQTTEHTLRVRIAPQDTVAKTSLPLRLAIALDTSASMEGEKLNQAKIACQRVLAQLRPRDQLFLAGFSDRVQPLLNGVTGNQVDTVQSELDKLAADGVTRTDLALNWLSSVLPPEPGIARVAILITDGHPTSAQGIVLEEVSPLIDQVGQLANSGIILYSVGFGSADHFNTGFLVTLSDRGRGAFVYAEKVTDLEPELQSQLTRCQAIATESARLQLSLAAGTKFKGFCRFRPDYVPLELNPRNELILGALRTNTATDILIALEIPALQMNDNRMSQEVLKLQISTLQQSNLASAAAMIQYTNSFRAAQEVNEAVNNDRLCWEINLYSTELNQRNDPMRTGELLHHIQAVATRVGQVAIADQAAQQYEDLLKTGQLNLPQSTGLLRDSRNLGGKA